MFYYTSLTTQCNRLKNKRQFYSSEEIIFRSFEVKKFPFSCSPAFIVFPIFFHLHYNVSQNAIVEVISQKRLKPLWHICQKAYSSLAPLLQPHQLWITPLWNHIILMRSPTVSILPSWNKTASFSIEWTFFSAPPIIDKVSSWRNLDLGADASKGAAIRLIVEFTSALAAVSLFVSRSYRLFTPLERVSASLHPWR